MMPTLVLSFSAVVCFYNAVGEVRWLPVSSSLIIVKDRVAITVSVDGVLINCLSKHPSLNVI